MNQKVINQLVVDTYNLHFPRIEKELTKLAKLILEIKKNKGEGGGNVEFDSELIDEINRRIDDLNALVEDASFTANNAGITADNANDRAIEANQRVSGIESSIEAVSSTVNDVQSSVETIITENQTRDQNIFNLDNEVSSTKGTLMSLVNQVNNYDIDSLKYEVSANTTYISDIQTNMQNHESDYNEFKTAYNQHILDQNASNQTFAQHVNDVSAVQLVFTVEDGNYFESDVEATNEELNHDDIIRSLCLKVNGHIRNSLNELRAAMSNANFSEMKDDIDVIDDQITTINANYAQLRTELDIMVGNVNSIVGRDDPLTLSDGSVTSVEHWIPYYQTRIETYITKIEELYEACTTFNEQLLQHEHKIESLNRFVGLEEGRLFFNDLVPTNNCYVIKATIDGKTRYIPALGDRWVRSRYTHLSDYSSDFDKVLGDEIYICYNDINDARSDFFSYRFINGVNKDTIKKLHFIYDGTDDQSIYLLFATSEFIAAFENIEEVHFAECMNLLEIKEFDCPAMYFSNIKYFSFPKNLRTLNRYNFFGDNYGSNLKSTDFDFVYPDSLVDIGRTRIIYTPDKNWFYYPPNVRSYADYSIVFPQNENLKCKNFLVKPSMSTDLSFRLFSLGSSEYIPNIFFERGCTAMYSYMMYNRSIVTRKFDIHVPYTIEYLGPRNFELSLPQDPKPEIYVEGELLWKSVVENDKHVLKINFRKMPNIHTVYCYFLEVQSDLANLHDFVEIEFPRKLKTIGGDSDTYILNLDGKCFEDNTKNKIIIYDQIESITSSVTSFAGYNDISKHCSVEYRVKEGRTEEEYMQDPMYVFLSNISAVTLTVSTYKNLDLDF